MEDAVACYREAVRLKPDDPVGAPRLGQSLAEAGKVQRGRRLLPPRRRTQAGLRRGPLRPGQALQEQGKIDEAVACYHRALQLEPDFAAAYNNLGVAYQHQGRLDEAVACCRRAVEFTPDDAKALSNLGNGLKDQGKLDGSDRLLPPRRGAEARRRRRTPEPGLAWLLAGDCNAVGRSTNGGGGQAVAAPPFPAAPLGRLFPAGKTILLMPKKYRATRCSSSAMPRWSNLWEPR